MYQDYKDLLSAFNAHGVRYLIVGGYAVIFHAQPRYTKDIDLFIKADPANAQATWAALASFGASLEGMRPEEFADPSNFFRFGRDPQGIDIMPGLSGVDFDAVWERRVGCDPASGGEPEAEGMNRKTVQAVRSSMVRPSGNGSKPRRM